MKHIVTHQLIRQRLFSAVLAALLFGTMLIGTAGFVASPAKAIDPVYTGFLSSTALGGYDPVAYFKQGKPVKGLSAYKIRYNGATWKFASKANLAAFKASPESYAPQYGGYCAWAVAQGKSASGDPRYWKIVDGKLYLNYNADIQKRWEKDIPGFIRSANARWPALLKK